MTAQEMAQFNANIQTLCGKRVELGSPFTATQLDVIQQDITLANQIHASAHFW